MAEPKPYSWTSGYNNAGIMIGLFSWGLAYVVWTVNASPTASVAERFWLVAVVTIFIGFGALCMGFRTSYAIFPTQRLLLRKRTFFNIPVGTRRWDFTDISGVELLTISGPRGGAVAFCPDYPPFGG